MRQTICALSALVLISTSVSGQQVPAKSRAEDLTSRYVIADQDASGPGGSDMASLLVFLQSPKVNLLGITVVTGDSWRDAEVAHALRLLELMGRRDIKVYRGAAFPLVRTQEWTTLASNLYGKATWMGAWREESKLVWDEVPPLAEGNPSSQPAEEDAAHFMIRMVHLHPHQVTIYGAGPLTNIALAVRLDPHFAELAQELIVMGGSLNPRTEAAEWVNAPRHEFNFWFDPEAASITLTAKWAKITVTTIDASIQTHLHGVLTSLQGSKSRAARYLVQYTRQNEVSDYAWDELAAATWLDPGITARVRDVYMDVNVEHGPNYGDVLIFSESDKPKLSLQKVHAQVDVNASMLEKDLIDLFAAETPHARNASDLPSPSP